MRDLYRSISERWRPEDVARQILSTLDPSKAGKPYPQRSSNLRAARARPKTLNGYLEYLAAYSSGHSSMSTKFAKADGLERQIKVASELFPDVLTLANVLDAVQVRAYIDALKVANGQTGRKAGLDFLADRRNRGGRRHLKGVAHGHRAYNKRFRLIGRMEAKYGRWLEVGIIKSLAQIAKTKLALRITWEDFSSDQDTAFFIAYMTARLGVRSLFTWGKQQGAFDQVAEMLLGRIDPAKGNWWAVAHVYPTQEVLDRLTDEQKGRLLGTWFDLMHTAARVLRKCQESDPGLDLKNLVVRRGNDSSTWNEAAGAFNKCRDGWVSTLYALGMHDVLETLAPPKALRLMAADVVYMHRAYGSGGLEPDTKVWQALPFCWDVVLGTATCTRAQIEAACEKNGVQGKGWIAPRPKSVETTTPTPELVHGVVVASPFLALQLRKRGYFSGPSKGLKGDPIVTVDRDYSDGTLKVSSGTGQVTGLPPPPADSDQSSAV